jgi:antitoxin CptB
MSAAATDTNSQTATMPAELTEQAALRKRRLRWQCRRGMRELDLMLLRFVDQRYDQLSDAQQTRFEQLLQNQDQLLLAWLMGHQQATDPQLAVLIEQIRKP